MKVKAILEVREKDFKDLDKTIFQDGDNRVVYTYSRIEEGKEYAGDVTKDKAGNWKYSKPKSSSYGSFKQTKNLTADPEKTASIERQVALKSAIELMGHNLVLMKDVPTVKDQAGSVLIIANIFNYYLHTGKPMKKEETGYDKAKSTAEGLKKEDSEIEDFDIDQEVVFS